MGKKMYLSDSDCGMIAGARRAGVSISVTADLLGFFSTTVPRVYSELLRKTKKHSVSGNSAAVEWSKNVCK